MSDNYVLVRGGLVQNTPPCDVLDCDVLDGSPSLVGKADVAEVKELKAKAEKHKIDDLVAECERWLSEFDVDPEVRIDVMAPRHEPEW